MKIDEGLIRLGLIRILFLFVLLSLAASTTFITKAFAAQGGESYKRDLENLVQKGGYIISKNGEPILSRNPDVGLIPASIWKIVTALAALENLGKDFRFTTEFYRDEENNLYIKGLGDPFLVSEEIALILDRLGDHNVKEIKDIYLDDSSFEVPTPPAGASNSLNPYDVINGALAVNFNTVNIKVLPDGRVLSAEEQTPTLPIMLELGGNLQDGTHRINISQAPENVLRHTGELFRELQERHNIPGSGEIIIREVPPDLEPVYIHRSSKVLTDLIEALMLYSNNYITNQLYLAMGALEFGYPATWEKAKASLQNYIHTSFPSYEEEITVDEGSGLSRENRITPRALLAILERFKSYARLLPLEEGRRIKSGSLKDVYSYAGFFQKEDGYDCFVIILNQPHNNRDEALDILERIYRQSP